jgi:hypothetical protein
MIVSREKATEIARETANKYRIRTFVARREDSYICLVTPQRGFDIVESIDPERKSK